MDSSHSETNTLAPKLIDTETTQVAVALKVLIEQMREQVQALRSIQPTTHGMATIIPLQHRMSIEAR